VLVLFRLDLGYRHLVTSGKLGILFGILARPDDFAAVVGVSLPLLVFSPTTAGQEI